MAEVGGGGAGEGNTEGALGIVTQRLDSVWMWQTQRQRACTWHSAVWDRFRFTLVVTLIAAFRYKHVKKKNLRYEALLETNVYFLLILFLISGHFYLCINYRSSYCLIVCLHFVALKTTPPHHWDCSTCTVCMVARQVNTVVKLFFSHFFYNNAWWCHGSSKTVLFCFVLETKYWISSLENVCAFTLQYN